MKTEAIVEKLRSAARAAADVVMRIYGEPDFGVEMKGKGDPVTRADREANAVLLDLLQRDLPGIPIVAEESDPKSYRGFEAERAALFVDPIDGTKEFIDRNGEFGVMIGYAVEGRAVAGVIVCPALGLSYAAIVGGRVDPPVHVSKTAHLKDARCAVSRSNRKSDVERRLALLGLRELVPTGSVALKAARIATGELDLYAHPTSNAMKLWDACAPDALVRAAGGTFTDARGTPFDYRGAFQQGAGMLASNGLLHDDAVRRLTEAG
jgi:3'(2'), 5'-bisphosphate nucleotidase